MSLPKTQLQPGKYYHISNFSNGNENLFDSETDYFFFKKRLRKYALPISDVIAYHLQPDQFHLILKMKDQNEINSYLETLLTTSRFNILSQEYYFIEKRLSKNFSNFFNSYAKHYNLVSGRKGNLFHREFEREAIESEEELCQRIVYVHSLLNNLSANGQHWKYNSYQEIIQKRTTLISFKNVCDIFGGSENFLAYHENTSNEIVTTLNPQ